MPLHRGWTPETFERNVRLLHRENARRKKKRSRKQILTIAYAQARRAAEAEGRKPAYLRARKRRSKPRRSR